MRLYVEGYNARKGWIISRTWSDEECIALPNPSPDELTPVRFVKSREKAMQLVQRWNRRYATH